MNSNSPEEYRLGRKYLHLRRSHRAMLEVERISVSFKENRSIWLKTLREYIIYPIFVGVLLLLSINGLVHSSGFLDIWSEIREWITTETASNIARNWALLLAAVIGFPIAIWRSIVASHQARIASRQADIAERGQVTDRLSKAIEHLGLKDGKKPNFTSRIGAVYALERIARDSRNDASIVFDVLSAYVRMEADPAAKRESLDTYFNREHVPERALVKSSEVNDLRPDIAAVMSACRNIGRFAFANVDFRGVSLNRADLSDSELFKINLNGADLLFSEFLRADLRNASFKMADLYAAILMGANLEGANLEFADLEYANLRGANLRNANLRHAKLEDADFKGANLEGANVEGVNLAMVDFANSEVRPVQVSNE